VSEARYFTIGDIAGAAGVGRTAVRGWIRRGRLRPAAKAGDGMLLFAQEDVTAWLEQWRATRQQRPGRTR